MAFAWPKSKKSLCSRTSSGKPSTDAEAGRSAPSGVVRTYTDPECFHPGYSARPYPADAASTTTAMRERAFTGGLLLGPCVPTISPDGR